MNSEKKSFFVVLNIGTVRNYGFNIKNDLFLYFFPKLQEKSKMRLIRDF